MSVEAVIFDLGGVILDSPLAAIAAFEQRHSIRPDTINRHVFASGSGGAWARHERGELAHTEFLAMFRAEFERDGIDVDTAELMTDVDASIRVRPEMLRAVDRIRKREVRVAALTNNWTPFGSDGLATHFDVVVESVVEGTRKPERRIYEICIERLGVAPAACVMLDDLGPNLKPALAMGMRTVKVTSAAQALAELEAIFGPLKL